MKIIKKIKNVFWGICVFLMLLVNKIFAIDIMPPVPLYGVSPLEELNFKIERIFKLYILPITLLIGIIVFLKRKKINKKVKILIWVIIGIILLIFIVLKKLINYFISIS